MEESYDWTHFQKLCRLGKNNYEITFIARTYIYICRLRIGYMTGPKGLIGRLILHMQVSAIHSSALSQTIVYKMLEQLGIDGFIEHTKK
jgi:kynurenine/2-aminoadipate aminotransferase